MCLRVQARGLEATFTFPRGLAPGVSVLRACHPDPLPRSRHYLLGTPIHTQLGALLLPEPHGTCGPSVVTLGEWNRGMLGTFLCRCPDTPANPRNVETGVQS